MLELVKLTPLQEEELQEMKKQDDYDVEHDMFLFDNQFMPPLVFCILHNNHSTLDPNAGMLLAPN